jgi:hypothetical protein
MVFAGRRCMRFGRLSMERRRRMFVFGCGLAARRIVIVAASVADSRA